MPNSKAASRPYKLWAALPDVHLPQEDKPAIAAVEKYLADECWDGWVCLGDLLDCDAISDFNRDFARRRAELPTLQEEFDTANSWLDRHQAVVRAKNPDARMVYLEGNHEYRTERYADRNPELAGLVDVERALRLKSRKIEYVRYWSQGDLFKLGKLYFGHGVYTGPNHSLRTARDYGVNITYGHCHDVQSAVIRRRGKDHPIMAQSLGCLCRYEQAYMRGKPINWTTAFGVVMSFPDGTFQLFPVNIIGHKFIGPSNGKLYCA